MLAYFEESVWVVSEFLKVMALKATKIISNEMDSKVFCCLCGGKNWLNEMIHIFFLTNTDPDEEVIFMVPMQNRIPDMKIF